MKKSLYRKDAKMQVGSIKDRIKHPLASLRLCGVLLLTCTPIKKTDPLWGSQQVGTDSPRILGVGWDPRRNSFKLRFNIGGRFC